MARSALALCSAYVDGTIERGLTFRKLVAKIHEVRTAAAATPANDSSLSD